MAVMCQKRSGESPGTQLLRSRSGQDALWTQRSDEIGRFFRFNRSYSNTSVATVRYQVINSDGLIP